MKKLATTLAIRREDGRIQVTMRVCTLLQFITDWNRRHFDLEMEACGSFLGSGDLKEAEWEIFKKGNRKAAFLWTLTAGICESPPPASLDSK